jgi:hypothetical protein
MGRAKKKRRSGRDDRPHLLVGVPECDHHDTPHHDDDEGPHQQALRHPLGKCAHALSKSRWARRTRSRVFMRALRTNASHRSVMEVGVSGMK